MSRLTDKTEKRKLRKNRVRSVVSGTSERPRLSVFISNMHVTAQVIDDTKHTTIAYVTTVSQKEAKGSLSDKASWVGQEIAKKAKAAKVKKVVLDRNGRIYHGRIKLLADNARKEGLEF